MDLLSPTEYKLNEYAAITMVYFERHKLIEIATKILVECALYRPSNVQLWIALNIERIAKEIQEDCLVKGRNGVIQNLFLHKRFLYRIVIFGRPGSGRKTQAVHLAARYNLVLIDAEILIHQHLMGSENHPDDKLDRELQRAFYYDNCVEKSKALLNIIGRRVLQKDCLQRGWVLVNYPHTLQDFKNILENFNVPPNKLVYLKCRQIVCMRRLMAMPPLGKPNHKFTYYKEEMRYFNKQERYIYFYLRRRYETIFINAEHTSKDVKTAIFTAIIKSPYMMDFKPAKKK